MGFSAALLLFCSIGMGYGAKWGIEHIVNNILLKNVIK